MHGKTHSIIRLQAYLSSKNSIIYEENGEIERNELEDLEKTTITAYFELNRINEYARTLLYTEIPLYYLFENKKWIRRKNKLDNYNRVFSQ